jgi:hypothetical protein
MAPTLLLGGMSSKWQRDRMDSGSIRGEHDLESLLESTGQQAVPWAAVSAARTAIRAIPFGVLAAHDDHKVIGYLLPVFRFCIMSWAASNISRYDFSRSAYFASGEMLSDQQSGNSAFVETAKSAVEAIEAAHYKRDWEEEPEFGHTVIYSAAECLNYARSAATSAIDKYMLSKFKSGVNHETLDEARSLIADALFDAIGTDGRWLSAHPESSKAARRLTARKLWLKGPPRLWLEIWEDSKRRLFESAYLENYSVWIDWYERRIRGERAAFDIPGDKGRIEDKKILRRLAEATDEDFWGKGHEYVNATLKSWLEEARARVAPPPPIFAEASGILELSGSATAEVQPLPPPQNRNAICFRQDEDGRIAIETGASVEQLRVDAEARDRHAEAVSEALAVLNRCRGNNAAARLTLRLENYLAAIGTSIEEVKPSLLVQRGERLRQELAAYAAPDTLLDPIADDILVDLKGWQSAHNMMVGLDPVLMAMDTAMLGPDRRPSLISPDEIRQFAQDAQAADILAAGVEDILIETADLAPAIPDPNDRRTIWSGEAVRNLALEAFAIALNHPKTSASVVVAARMLSSNLVAGVVGGFSIWNSIKAAEYLVAHRRWIEDKMGNTQTWQALFVKVADWIERVTPFKPK